MISFLYQRLLRPVLFLFNPEDIHDFLTNIGQFLGKFRLTKFLTHKLFYFSHPSLTQTIASLKFTNPVGLSAGFDKDANLINILANVGFGFMQVGSITHKPYEGNPQPRLYRLKKSKGLLVYYGLKNIGVKKITKKLKKRKDKDFLLGLSVAKTNCQETVGVQAGVNDYFNCLKQLKKVKVGDYYTLNISCPNTFGGEPFTDPAKLTKLLNKISTLNIKKPIFLKLAINLPWLKFRKLLEVAIKFNITGVIIGNLNKNRQDKAIKDTIPPDIFGSASGLPCQKLSNQLIKKTYQSYGDKLIIIGVGGIFSSEDAYQKIKLGASLVQLITGMIYQGPQLIGQINRDLVELLKKDGYNNISQAVGASHRR